MVKSFVCSISFIQEGIEHMIAAADGVWTAVDDDDDDAVNGPDGAPFSVTPPRLPFAAAFVRKVFGRINKILLKPGI